MTRDEAIKKLLKELKHQHEKVIEELEGEEHDCDCEYCDFEEEIDEETEIELQKQLEEIDADIARYSALKLSEGT